MQKGETCKKFTFLIIFTIPTVVLTFPEQAVCQFPFIYKDKPHYECVNDDKYPWCGLTENVDNDWKRGWCPDKGMNIGNRVVNH